MRGVSARMCWRSDKGAALTEFALVAPILLFLIFAVAELGHFIAYSNAVETAAREGARYGSAVGIGPNGVAQYIDCMGIRDAAREKINLVTLADGDISISYDSGPGTATEPFDCNSGPFPTVFDVGNGERVVVTVSTNYSPLVNLPFVGGLLNSTIVEADGSRSIFPEGI